jgi:general secretion pathway protein I
VQMGRNFKGTLKVQPTPNPSFRRVDTSIANEDGREMLTISTVMTH